MNYRYYYVDNSGYYYINNSGKPVAGVLSDSNFLTAGKISCGLPAGTYNSKYTWFDRIGGKSRQRPGR